MQTLYFYSILHIFKVFVEKLRDHHRNDRDAQEQVDSLHQQIEAAKLEITQPFPQELELTTKSARLAELDALLSMDKSAPMNSKSEKPSVLASLERGSSGMQKDTPQRRSDRPLDAAL